jgi:hypothetical protein
LPLVTNSAGVSRGRADGDSHKGGGEVFIAGCDPLMKMIRNVPQKRHAVLTIIKIENQSGQLIPPKRLLTNITCDSLSQELIFYGDCVQICNGLQ